VLLAKSVGCSRYVYNWGLAESKRCYEQTGKRPKLGELKAALVELKKTDAPWLYEVSAHKLSSSLAKTKSVTVLEDLHVRGMQRNHHLARSISDAGMGELRRQLSYKSEWYGSPLVVADRYYPSSKLCSGCGCIKQSLSLSERTYDCDACGLSLDRDENAAINLRRLGLAQLPEGLREVTPVERKALASAHAEVKPASLKQEATARGARRATRRSTPKDVLVPV
jgi:IS605 OrfB family transposase